MPSNLAPALTNENDIEVLNTGVCPAHYSAPKVGLDPLHFGDCAYGDASGKRLLDIFGDSHAGMWLTAIRYAAARTGWKVRIFYFPGCPAPDITFYSTQTNSPNTGCNAFRTDAIAAIRKTHPAMVVVTSASFEQQVSKGVAATSAQWETGLSKTLSMLKMPGTQLAVMGDIPILSQDDPTCLAAHETDVKACVTPLATAETGVYVSAEEQAASANGALLRPDRAVDLRPTLCPDRRAHPCLQRPVSHQRHVCEVLEWRRANGPATWGRPDRRPGGRRRCWSRVGWSGVLAEAIPRGPDDDVDAGFYRQRGAVQDEVVQALIVLADVEEDTRIRIACPVHGALVSPGACLVRPCAMA